MGCASSGASGGGAKAEAAGGSETVHCGGINSCKGQGACAGNDNSCKALNECKGKGWVDTSAADCKEKGGSVVTSKM